MSIRTMVRFVEVVCRQLQNEVSDLRKLPEQVRALRAEFDQHKAELSTVAHTATMWRVVNKAQESCPDCGLQWTKGGEENHYNFQEVRCPRLKA